MTDRIVPQKAHSLAGPGFAPPLPLLLRGRPGSGAACHAGPHRGGGARGLPLQDVRQPQHPATGPQVLGGGTTLGPGLFGRSGLKVVNGVFHMRRHTRRWFMECEGLFLPCVAV